MMLFVVGAVFLLPAILDGTGIGELTSLTLTLLRWPVLLVPVCSSMLFEWVISKFASFDVVYGSLSALIGFMIWLSAIVVLFGAEVEAAAGRRARPSISSRYQSGVIGSRSQLRGG